MIENILIAIINSLPIFATITVSLFLKNRGLFTDETKQALRVLIFKFVLPCFAFKTIYQLSLNPAVMEFLPLLFIIVALLLLSILAYTKFTKLGRGTTGSLLIASLAYAAGPFAYPFVQLNFDQEMFNLVVFFDVVLFLSIMFVGPVIATIYSQRGSFSPGQVIRAILKDVTLLAIALAVAFNTTGVIVPAPVLESIKFMGNPFSFLTLIYLSLNLKLPSSQEFRRVVWVVLGRNVLILLAVLALTAIFTLDKFVASALLLTMLVPFSSFPLVYTEEYKLDSKVIAQLNIVSLLLCLLIYPLLVGVVKTLI